MVTAGVILSERNGSVATRVNPVSDWIRPFSYHPASEVPEGLMDAH
jgi:hypothetical protein